MELKTRLDLLIQSAQIAQQHGILSLDDAVITKAAIDAIQNNKEIKKSIEILIKIAHIAQQKGAFSLKDAFYIYMAIEGIEQELEKIEEPTSKKKTKKDEK